MVKDIQVAGKNVSFTIVLTYACLSAERKRSAAIASRPFLSTLILML
jgi:hypothetical protein